MNQNNDMNAGRTEQANDETQGFRVHTLKIFGGIQILFGMPCAVLSLVAVIMDGAIINAECIGYNYEFYILHECKWYARPILGFDTTCLIFSGWCLLTGLLPFCMNKKRGDRWRCLKTAYMVCCIIGAAVFMPTIFGLGVAGSVIRGNDNSGGLVAIPIFLALFGLVEMIVAIVASAFCCCCSSWGSSCQYRMVYITTNNPGMIINMPQIQIPNQQISLPLAHPVTFQPTNDQSFVQAGQQTTNNQSFGQARQQYYLMPAATFFGAATDQQSQNGNRNPPPYTDNM